MDINANNNHSAQIFTKTDATNIALNQDAINSKASNQNVADLNRDSLVQSVKVNDSITEPKVEPKEDLVKVVKELTDMMAIMQKGLKFSVDEDSGHRVIKVQDVASGDIIRQIPSEEALQLAEKLSEVSGILMKIEV
jgi:flagellar protein FlaG